MSISRYGDGEFGIMTNNGSIGFQKYNCELKERLVETFKTRYSNILVCMPDINLRHSKAKSKKMKHWKITYLKESYNRIKPIIDYKYVYGNAGITRFYHPWTYKDTNFSKTDAYILQLKKIWHNRDLLIIEGVETKLGVGNDLFANAASIKRILVPSIDAFDHYNKIVEQTLFAVEKYKKKSNVLMLLAIGPTASILSVDLYERTHIQTLDIGHIDVVYMWYINRCTSLVGIKGKYVNEKQGADNIDITFNESEYRNQIIYTIQ